MIYKAKVMNKKELNLDFLNDDQFSSFVKMCRKNKITKRMILQVTKYIKPENFNIDKFMLFHEKRKNFPKQGRAYIPEYVALRNNISIQEAKIEIENFKKDKATSKDGFIKRHGKEEGERLFKKFQQTSAYSSNEEYLKEKYGETWKEQFIKQKRESSKWCTDFFLKRGYSEQESKKLVSEWQRKNAGANKRYWKEKGLSDEEIDLIITEINNKKGLTSRNKKIYIEKYGDSWLTEYEKYSELYRKNMEEKGLWIAQDLKNEWKKYHELCWFYTNCTIAENNIKDIDKRSRKWHLDHKFSIKQGFTDDVNPKIIGSIYNLHIIPSIENSRKKEKCSISKSELIRLYNENKKN